MQGRWAFQVENENSDPNTFDFGDFPNCTQAQSGPEFFALVESIRLD
jgi:hypothetical protein